MRRAPQATRCSGSSTGVPTDRSSSAGRRGYYNSSCYLPLYMFVGDHLVGVRQCPSNQDASAGALQGVVITAKPEKVCPLECSSRSPLLEVAST